MYLTIEETNRRGAMSTIKERTGAKDVTVPAKGMLVRGYDFDPHTLNEDERDFIFRALMPVGLDAFVQNPSEAMERDIRDHLFSADHLLVMRSDGSFSFGPCGVGDPRPIAFRMWKTYEVDGLGKCLYLAGMCIKPTWQGRGIGQQMTKYALASDDFDYVFTVSQNPVVKECFDKAVGNEAFPTLQDWHWRGLETRAKLAEALGKREILDYDTGVLKGNYGSSLYGELPVSRTLKYNELFARLDRNAGDAYLIHCSL